MPALKRWTATPLALAAAVLLTPEDAAAACTTATTSTSLGSHSSYAVATTSQQGSGTAGLQCDILLAALTTHYVGLRVDASNFLLTSPNPNSQNIAYTASLTPNGAALTVGNFQDLSSFSLVSLFAGTNNSIPIYFRTAATPGLRAGTYTGFMDLRWYYSVCSVGVVACISFSNSPGFVRPLIVPLNWGTGVSVRVNVQMIVENDCIITAPKLEFGSAPLAGSFNPVTRTIVIRCSAGAAYTVGLDNGAHPVGGARRMTNGSNALQYEIYKTTASPDRWGDVGSARRSSLTADTNPGVHDSLTTQGFTYRAEVLPGQPTPPAGSYLDTIRIDVAF